MLHHTYQMIIELLFPPALTIINDSGSRVFHTIFTVGKSDYKVFQIDSQQKFNPFETYPVMGILIESKRRHFQRGEGVVHILVPSHSLFGPLVLLTDERSNSQNKWQNHFSVVAKSKINLQFKEEIYTIINDSPM